MNSLSVILYDEADWFYNDKNVILTEQLCETT